MTQTTPPAEAASAAEVIDFTPSDDPAAVVLPPDVAPSVVPLPPDLLPCRDCGAPRPGPVVEQAHPREVDQGGPGIGRTRPVLESDLPRIRAARFTRCDACTSRAVLAARLTEALDSRLGSLGTNAERRAEVVAATLRALAVVGVDTSRTPLLPTPAQAEAEPVAAARRLIATARRLALGGVGTRWASRFSPTWSADADPATCSAAPWSYTLPELRATLRQDVGTLLAVHVARVAPPREVRPPVPDPFDVPRGSVVVSDGCLVCGVRSVPVPAAEVTAHPLGLPGVARQVWTLRTLSASGLGVARPGGRRVTGYACPRCQAALQAVGSVGPHALARCLAAALLPEVERRGGLADVRGVTPYAAAYLAATDHHRPAPRPSAPGEPWHHLAPTADDRAALVETLERVGKYGSES